MENMWRGMEMDYKQKKEWLAKCRALKLTIVLCDEDINDPSGYQSPVFDQRIVSTKADNTTAVQRIERVQAEREQAEQEFEKRRDAINNLQNGEERLILHLRYIKGLKWEDVQLWLYNHDYPMSEKTIYNRHKSGVLNIETLQ